MHKEKEHDSKVDSAMRAFEEAHGESQRLLREQQALLDQGEVQMLHGIGMGTGKGGAEDTEHEHEHEDGEITGAKRKVAWGEAEEQGTEVRLYLSVSIEHHHSNRKVNSYFNQSIEAILPFRPTPGIHHQRRCIQQTQACTWSSSHNNIRGCLQPTFNRARCC